MNPFLRQLIVFIVKALAKVSSAQWEQVVDLVIRAEETILLGSDKEAWVRSEMSKALPSLARWAADLVFSSALGFAAKKGWINLTK